MLLPGSFASPRRPLVTVSAVGEKGDANDLDEERILEAFVIGTARTFYDDPRYALVVLSEIGSRALSPAVNDPGTAIHILGSLVRLLSTWAEVVGEEEKEDPEVLFDRILLPEIAVSDMFEDAFHAIARDGASMIEVGIRLQKSLAALAALAPDLFRDAAMTQAHRALRHGEKSLRLEEDVERLRRAATWMMAERNQG
jgi:uncharacterized membrane protein